jgi:adenosylhomocysteinase
MMILEGAKWEVKYENSKELPDPSKFATEDERMLMEILRDTIPSFPTKFRDLLKDFYGCSEETTTGVHRLI